MAVLAGAKKTKIRERLRWQITSASSGRAAKCRQFHCAITGGAAHAQHSPLRSARENYEFETNGFGHGSTAAFYEIEEMPNSEEVTL